MDKQTLNKYLKASEISKKVKLLGKKLAKPGMSYLKLSEKLEAETRKLGADLAFPANISVNNVAAHYCSKSNDKSILKAGDLLKIDVGVQIDGYIVDSAISIGIGTKKHDKLIDASKKAVENAIKLIKPRARASDIGAKIEKTIESYGFKSIRNLSGHAVERYTVHAGYSIPNFKSGNYVLKKGDVIAIEPFATDGRGRVKDGASSSIYELAELKPVRLHRDVLKYIIETYKTLPFSQREIEKKFNKIKTTLALRSFAQAGILHDHKILLEKPGALVSQHEHTIIVDDKPIVLG